MKTRKLVSILILVLAVLIIIGDCATTPKTQEEREGVNQEVFLKSVEGGDFAEVKKFVEAGADVNASINEVTALMFASGARFWCYSKYTNPEVVQFLIEAGADINDQSNDGRTALMFASAGGHTQVAELLIEAGADINAQSNNDGRTALMFTSQLGHTEVAKLLIEAGADVNAQSNNEVTALMFASAGGHTAVAELLIGAGAK